MTNSRILELYMLTLSIWNSQRTREIFSG